MIDTTVKLEIRLPNGSVELVEWPYLPVQGTEVIPGFLAHFVQMVSDKTSTRVYVDVIECITLRIDE